MTAALVDPRDQVYELRRAAAATRRQADALHEAARDLERSALELDRALRRPTVQRPSWLYAKRPVSGHASTAAADVGARAEEIVRADDGGYGSDV